MTKSIPFKNEGHRFISSDGLPLRINFLWTLLGNIVYAGSQWGMLMILAKLGNPEMVGQFSLGLAITAPVILLTNLQLRAVQATDAKRKHLFGHYLALRLFSTGLALALICAIVFFSGYRRETVLVILAVGFAKAVESIADVTFGLLQQHERMDRIAVSMMIKGLFSLVALAGCVWLTGSVVWGSLGLALAWVTVLFLYDTRSIAFVSGIFPEKDEPMRKTTNVKISLRPNWDFDRLASLAWISLPLGLSAMMVSLNSNIPRYFIHHYLGERDLGIFAAMAYLMIIGRMVVGALGQSAVPRLAKYASLGRIKALRSLLWKLIGLGIFLGSVGLILVLVAGREIMTLIYRPEYAARVDVLFWLMLAAGVSFVASFLGYGMTALRHFKVQIPLFILVSGATALSCYQLIPTSGLKGAAQALLVAGFVQLGLTALVVWNVLKNLK